MKSPTVAICVIALGVLTGTLYAESPMSGKGYQKCQSKCPNGVKSWSVINNSQNGGSDGNGASGKIDIQYNCQCL